MSRLKLFGTDGIRGEANSTTMNTEIAVAVGRAAAYFSNNIDELPKIVIGKDTRLSCYMLEEALASGITSMGIDVIKTGPLPTPGVAFICRSTRARLGIIISASHNPAEQNGIKIFDHSGIKLSYEDEAKIEGLMFDKIPEKHMAKPAGIGKIFQIHDAAGRYVQHLKETFPYGINLKGVKIALDVANGAAYSVAPDVFTELGANVTTINDKPNGLNINDGCGALHPKMICELTKKIEADIGITLDGDADRVLLSDENGDLVDGDAILYICAKHLKSKGHLGESSVVGTIMTNHALDVVLKKEGISLARTDVGDNNVVAYMREHNINLGGEPSGHLIYLHHSPTGDGVLGALRILSIMQQHKKPLSELVKPYKPYPQKTINIKVKEKVPLNEINEITDTKRAIDEKLGNTGRTLLRYSGTEMIARITVESDNEKTTDEAVSILAEVVRKHLGC